MVLKQVCLALIVVSDLYTQQPKESLETFPAILEPIQHAVVMPLVATRVVALPYKLGDSFHKGDILIQFDSEQIKANVKKADAALSKAREDYNVKKDLAEDRLMSNLELLEAESNLATALADDVAAKQLLAESAIRAPYDGKIANVGIHIFEIPSKDKPVLEIFNDQILILNILVPSHYLSSMHQGQKLYVHISDTGEIVVAQIKRIGPIVNAASGTVKVEAEIDNSQGKLKSGMASQAAFNRNAFEGNIEPVNQILEELKKQ